MELVTRKLKKKNKTSEKYVFTAESIIHLQSLIELYKIFSTSSVYKHEVFILIWKLISQIEDFRISDDKIEVDRSNISYMNFNL